jgi:probable phosphoglycerate mutase
VSATITFIRHAESTGNRAGVWQGHTDAGLSDIGVAQLPRLASRLAGRSFDRVISSDLDRTMLTAAVAGDAVPDPRWRELHLGAWEGLTVHDIRRRDPDVLDAISAGADFAIPGGETAAEFWGRLTAAFDDLVSSLDDGEDVAVVSHGGVIETTVARILGFSYGFAPIQLPTNTALTTIRVDGHGSQVFTYNDACHVGDAVGVVRWSGTNVFLFRHGETDANVAGRWQGRRDGQLSATGRQQATALAATVPTMDRLFASPLSRARHTAQALTAGNGREIVLVDDLIEMDFGAWEDKTVVEAEELDPEGYDLIYRQGQDLPRGGTGESFTAAGKRMAAAIGLLVDEHGGTRIGLVTHGGVTRAYIAELLGLGFADRGRIPVMRNTARAHVVYTGRGPLLSEYNVAPHLEG